MRPVVSGRNGEVSPCQWKASNISGKSAKHFCRAAGGIHAHRKPADLRPHVARDLTTEHVGEQLRTEADARTRLPGDDGGANQSFLVVEQGWNAYS